MNRTSSRSDADSACAPQRVRASWFAPCAFLGAILAGCAGAPTEVARSDRRHPDGVAIDPIAATPEPLEVADASSGVVSLTTPLGSDAARATVRTFFEAVSREDLEALRGTLSSDATSINPATRVRDRVEYAFTRRFQRFEYFSLASVPFWQDDAMEVLRASEARALWSDTLGPGALGPGAPGPVGGGGAQLASPSSGDALDSGDVVVRLAVSAPRSGGTPLLGDTMTFLLRRSAGRYVVHRIVEEFALP